MRASLSCLVALLLPSAALAQAQKVTPPKTVYWLSAATQSGFALPTGGQPNAADMMRMAMGGGGPTKLLSLDLGSKLTPSGPPAALHAIPPGMAMGASLPLKTPVRTAGSAQVESEDFERPRGRLLLFWGCGEAARPGQPLVIDFAKVAKGEVPAGLFGGERVRIQRPPSSAGWPVTGHWPNDDRQSAQSVPAGAVLTGPHKVSGNYTPDIPFTLTRDWMTALRLAQKPTPSGAMALSWNSVPGTTGHFAQMMAGSDKGGAPTIVFWSSSEVQTFFSGLGDYVPPAEAQRLVAKKQLMPPSQTSCSIPKEALAAAEGGIISLVAHGPEENFVYPPRPADPKTTWVQEWAVKARYASRAGGIVGMDMEDMGAGMGAGNATAAGGHASDRELPKCKPARATGGGLGGALASAMSGGFLGKKPREECRD